jgi:hypothetical protein
MSAPERCRPFAALRHSPDREGQDPANEVLMEAVLRDNPDDQSDD